MFHFPTFPPTALYIQAEVAGHDSGISRFPYSEIPGSGARLPAPLGLSQVTTSFFGSWCQGIHRSHLVACQNFYKDARVHCEVLKIRAETQNIDQPQRAATSLDRRKNGHQKATESSGPNSVLEHHTPTIHVPLPPAKARGLYLHPIRMSQLEKSMFHYPVPAQPTTNVPELNKIGQPTKVALPKAP